MSKCLGPCPSPRAAYVVVAFLGAVSLSFPLYLAHLYLLAPAPPTAQPSAPSRLWPACVGLSLAAVVALPASVQASRPIFITALAVEHIVLLLPFIAAACAGAPGADESEPSAHGKTAAPPSGRARHAASKRVRAGYQLLALAVVTLHLRASLDAIGELARRGGGPSEWLGWLLEASYRNECQASIAIDAALASVAGGCYMVATGGWRSALLCCAAPLISPAACLALHASGAEAGRAHARADAERAATMAQRHEGRRAVGKEVPPPGASPVERAKLD